MINIREENEKEQEKIGQQKQQLPSLAKKRYNDNKKEDK
jgi:hypothetical protein